MISKGVALALDFQRDIRALAYTATAVVWVRIHATEYSIEIRSEYLYPLACTNPHPREFAMVSELERVFVRDWTASLGEGGQVVSDRGLYAHGLEHYTYTTLGPKIVQQ